MTKSKVTKRISAAHVALVVAAAGGALALAGCSTGGSSSSSATSTATWPSAPPPATTQTNTYVGTQSPGWYTVTIDHTSNTFSYQDLSTSVAAVSGTFTTTANGFLVLSTSTGSAAGYALEQLSRALLLVPTATAVNNQFPLTGNAIFAVAPPTCQVIPAKTKFEYIASPNAYYAASEETLVGSGYVYVSTDTAGSNWTFGGELQYILPNAATSSLNGISGVSFSPTPDPFSVTCATTGGLAAMQTAITVPNSLPANFAVGPTGYFVEDRYQSDDAAYVGAVEPPSPVDLGGLSGATFLGVNGSGGEATNASPDLSSPQLISVSAAPDSSGKSVLLTGAAFPSNDPSQTPVPSFVIDLGAQDSNNNGYYPSATYTGTCSSCTGTPAPSYALVTQAGGKYAIFVASGTGAGIASGWILFQQ